MNININNFSANFKGDIVLNCIRGFAAELSSRFFIYFLLNLRQFVTREIPHRLPIISLQLLSYVELRTNNTYIPIF